MVVESDGLNGVILLQRLDNLVDISNGIFLLARDTEIGDSIVLDLLNDTHGDGDGNGDDDVYERGEGMLVMANCEIVERGETISLKRVIGALGFGLGFDESPS